MRTDKKDWSETSSYRWADPPPPLMGLLLFGKELLLFGNRIRNVSRKQNSIIHGGSKILIDSYRWGPPVFGPLLCPSLLLWGNRIRNVSQRQKASYIDTDQKDWLVLTNWIRNFKRPIIQEHTSNSVSCLKITPQPSQQILPGEIVGVKLTLQILNITTRPSLMYLVKL